MTSYNDFKVFLSDIIGCKQDIVDRIKEYILKLLGYDKNTKLFISLTNPLLHPIDYNNGNIDLTNLNNNYIEPNFTKEYLDIGIMINTYDIKTLEETYYIRAYKDNRIILSNKGKPCPLLTGNFELLPNIEINISEKAKEILEKSSINNYNIKLNM